MEQVQIDPAGPGLIVLPRGTKGMQRLAWPRSCQEYESFLARWYLEPSVGAAALILGEWSARVLGLSMYIISGWRDCAEQDALPGAAPCRSSCHTTCPSAAFDAGWDFAPSHSHRTALGQRAGELGLRAGIFFSTPSPNHYDAGPCS